MRAQHRAGVAAVANLAVWLFFARACDRLANHRIGCRKHDLLDLLRNSYVPRGPHAASRTALPAIVLEIFMRQNEQIEGKYFEPPRRPTNSFMPTRGAAANTVGPDLLLSQRFKTIKETYQDNQRKVNESKRSGCGTEDVYKPKWFLWPHVQFLRKVCDMSESKHHKYGSNCTKSIQAYVIVQENSQFNLHSVEDTTMGSLLSPENSEMESCQASNSLSVHSTPSATPYCTPAPSPRSSLAPSATLMSTPSIQQQSTVRLATVSAPGTVSMPAMSPSLKADNIARESEAPPRTMNAADHLAQFIACRLSRTDETSAIREECENQLITLILQL
ncbi:hypothetical protein QAD02_008124 [Eretmocerus hayati]|uniref:Uncharacterized protein n=1 Tax=Eretmocerus hayati TaxID=131215 RepID=A0ACC2N7Z7_9HYME|nr:hypothetical protein QAD02_008124 [Eretmocerus hayati]